MRSGIELAKTALSAASREKNFGINSPNKSRTAVEIINIETLPNPKVRVRNNVLIDANAILTILFAIKIVGKRFCGFLEKKYAFVAGRLFFLARNSILSLFATTNASSEPERKPLISSNNMSTKKSFI